MNSFYKFLFLNLLLWVVPNVLKAQPRVPKNLPQPVSYSASSIEQGVLHVKFKEKHIGKIKGNKMAIGRFGISELDEASSKIKAQKVKRVFRHAGKFEKAHKQFGLHLWYEVRFDKNVDISTAIQEYKKLDQFELVEPSRKYDRPAVETKGAFAQNQGSLIDPTSDPLFVIQSNFRNTGQDGGVAGRDIKLPEAWTIQTGSSDVIVAVIDGGIDVSHPDLAGAMWTNSAETPANGIDDDNNGYVDDIHGYNFGDNTGTIYPDFHGTHVAGTIGAITNNGIGVAGIAGGSGTADGVRIMSLAGFGNVGSGGFEEAMVYAADHGAVISQNSWGGGATSIEAAIDYFIARAGFDNSTANFNENIQIGPMAGGIVIFATGNDNSDDPIIGYPASYEPVMAVAATNWNDQRAPFSNYGDWTDISAPGFGILSTYPVTLGSYAKMSGTSMACPHVSGVAALIVSQLSDGPLRPAQVWGLLQLTTDDIEFLNPAYVGLLGSGRLNAYQALLQTGDAQAPATIMDFSLVDEKLTSVIVSWTATGMGELQNKASFYNIRYATYPINPLNFESATLVTHALIPKTAGLTEQFEITGLTHNTQYYFAIEAEDLVGNSSGISNVITGTTLPPPVAEVSPLPLAVTLASGEKSTHSLTVQNSGQSNLFVSNLISSIASPVNQNLTSDTSAVSGRLFTLGADFITWEIKIYEHDPITGEEINEIELPEPSLGFGEGLAFDGKYLYYVNGYGANTNTIYRINPETGVIISTCTIGNIIGLSGLAHSGNLLYAYDYDEALIYEIDFNAEKIIRSITPADEFGQRLTSYSADISFGGKRGTIILTNDFEQHIYEIDLQTGIGHRTIPSNGIGYPGFGYSNRSNILFIADGYVTGGVMKMDIETGSIINFFSGNHFYYGLVTDETSSWIVPDNVPVTVTPGLSTEVMVTIDAGGLHAGSYEGSLFVKSNDPVTPVIEVPVALTVTGEPDLVLDKLSFEYGGIYVNAQRDSFLTITNKGTAELIVSTMESDNPDFGIEFSPFIINPGERKNIRVYFHPTHEGIATAACNISSNDPDQPAMSVSLNGFGITPSFSIGPSPLQVVLTTDGLKIEPLTITNIGSNAASWEISQRGDAAALEDVLTKLNSQHTKVNSLIPSRFNFTNGQTLNSIPNGGSNMYDGGNHISTNIGAPPSISYTNGLISTNVKFGTPGKYFTAKFPGLFVLCADIDISFFLIYGNLGANGTGSTDVTTIITERNGKTYKGFVRRVYGSTTPSVNHLVIVEDNGNVDHLTATSTGSDFHKIKNMEGINRLYYLLFSSTNGGYVSNNSMQSIMHSFLDVVADVPSWLSVTKNTGSLAGESSATVQAIFNSADLDVGDYEAQLSITDGIQSTPFSIPVTMTVVNGQTLPVAQVMPNTVTTNVYSTEPKVINLILRNTGSIAMNWIATTLPGWASLNATSGLIEAGSEQMLMVTLDASDLQEGDYMFDLLIQYNNPVSPLVAIPVSMTVILNEPPLIVKSIPDQVIELGKSEIELNLAEYFTDPDQDYIEYTLENGTEGIIDVSILGSVLTLDAIALGETTLMISADDDHGGKTELNFKVTVVEQAHTVAHVIPGAINTNVYSGENKVMNITLVNTGNNAMNWSIDALPIWATLNKTSGSIAVGTEQVLVLTLYTNTLTEQSYIFDLLIHCNNPAAPILTVPITMSIVFNHAPLIVKNIPNKILYQGDEEIIMNLAEYFADPDQDLLKYSFKDVDEGIISVSVLGSVLILNPIALGETSLTITCDDNHGGKVDLNSTVIVTPVTALSNSEIEIITLRNYPNPFIDKTTITYYVPNNVHVSLSVYDVTGVLIEKLVDEEQSQGNKEIQFKRKDISSGVYFYRLVMGGKSVEVGKMFKRD